MEGPGPGFAYRAANHRLEGAGLAERALVDVNEDSAEHNECGDIVHDISALIMLGGIFIHIYQSTFGEPGTFQSMVRGAVSEAWAWTFHPAWYKQVTGRDPEQACKEARRQMTGGKP